MKSAMIYEFPKFDGNGLEGWVMRSEFFFEIAKVVEDREKVKTAVLHPEGKALQWHRGFVSLQGEGAYTDWGGYVRAMSARFGTHAYEDPLADLTNLRQIKSLQEYMDEFDELYPRSKVSGEQALSFFLSGLVDELQMPVRMFKPQSLDEAYALAKLQDLTVTAMQGKPKGSQGGGSSQGSSYSSNNKPLTVNTTNYKPSGSTGGYGNNKENERGNSTRPPLRLSSKKMEEKKAKNLCFWCPEKFTPNHRCSKRKSYVMQLLEELRQEEPEEKEEEEQGEAT